MVIYAFSENDLKSVARWMLDSFPDYTVFTLIGDLGAGKTSLVKSVCYLLESQDSVSSPTFSLVNEYKTIDNKSILHMDLYRLESEEELENIGFDDYLNMDSHLFIEWPSLALSYLDQYVQVEIFILDHNYRKFVFTKVNN